MADVVAVRRSFSETPLRRVHQRAVTLGETRRLRPIPWEKFDRSRYPEEALALAVNQLSALAHGEYLAVEQFARVSAALAMNGAPIDLVAAAARIPADEIRHADHALHMASLCAGSEVTLSVPRPVYDPKAGGSASLERLDMMMLELPTISETLSAALISACAERATDPVVRAVLGQIVADEVHHLRLGWYYLAWRAPQWSQAEVQRAADFAADMIVKIEQEFWQGRDARKPSKKAADALGVLDTKSQRAAVRRVMQDELVPGLDALGLGASHAWRARRRGRA